VGLVAYRNQKPEIIIENLDLKRYVYIYDNTNIGRLQERKTIYGVKRIVHFQAQITMHQTLNRIEQFQVGKVM
jgi:hypothetical protein